MSERRYKLGKLSEFKPGQMREIKVNGCKLLVAQVDGRIFAVGGTCPHYGAPLAQGTLHDCRVTCPWHQSVFDLRTGDLLEPPALDGLARFEVSIKDETAYVTLSKNPSSERTMAMCHAVKRQDNRIFAVIGAGAAAATAVETLRQENFRGRIVMIGREKHVPYDRPPCSKSYLAGQDEGDALPLRSAAFYREHEIERLEAEVTSLDVAQRCIRFRDQLPLTADAVLIATGAAPVPLKVPGSDLRSIYLLRSWEDSLTIRKAAEHASRVVVIGASFIGLEVAAALSEHDLDVTVVGREAVPFNKTFGTEVGRAIQRLHEKKGTRFELERSVKRFTGEHGKVSGVVLDNGTKLKTDFVVIGIGVRPATDFVKGVNRNDDGSLNVDEHLRVTEGVYAAGDLARFPSSYIGEVVRIEHWRLALQHGRTAARNMAGHDEPFTGVPFFWTRHFGKSICYVGHAPTFDDVKVFGTLKKLQFTAVYARGNKLLAAAGTEGNQLNAFAELMRANRLPTAEEIRNWRSARFDECLRS